MPSSVMATTNITCDLGVGYVVKSTDMEEVIAYVDAQFGTDDEIISMLTQCGAMNVLQDTDGCYLVDYDGALLIG